jgi:phasin family protein
LAEPVEAPSVIAAASAPAAAAPKRAGVRKAKVAEPAAAPEPPAPKARRAPAKKPAAPAPAIKAPIKAKAVRATPVAPKLPARSPRKPAIKPAAIIADAAPVARRKPLSEILPMSTTNFTTAIKTAFADVQGKAKVAYEKGAASVSEGTALAKGNVEAVVESSKILADGLQKLGTDFVAESRGAFETLTAEAKELAAVKTPADFFKLQSDLLRKNFDAAVAFSSKQTEAFVKLGSDSIAPISRRVTLAVESLKKAA